MDGTLLTSSHKISEHTANIIKKIEDSGVKFMIATGRPFLDARHYRDSLKLRSYLITSNGARAHDEDNNPIVVENIPKELVKRLLNYKVGKDIHRNIYLDDDWIIEYEIDGLVEFHKESGYGFNIDDLSKYQNEEVAKVFFLGENKEIEDLEKKMKKDFKEMLSLVGKPFIMGNASKRLIEALPNVEVIGNNNEDGIGEKLQEIFNIDL